MIVPWKVRECFIKSVIYVFSTPGCMGVLAEDVGKVNLDKENSMPGSTEEQIKGSIGLQKGRGARDNV